MEPAGRADQDGSVVIAGKVLRGMFLRCLSTQQISALKEGYSKKSNAKSDKREKTPKTEITEEFLASGKISDGLINKEQANLIRADWPLTPGWEARAVGKIIKTSTAEKYISIGKKLRKNKTKPRPQKTAPAKNKQRIVITTEFLDSGRSASGSITRAQKSILGVRGHPPGWEAGLLGKEISQALAWKYVLGKKEKKRQKRPHKSESTPSERAVAFFARHASPDPNPVYLDYITSSLWQAKSRYLRKLRKACNRCGNRDNLQGHHRHYRTLGHEHPDDIEILCCCCHAEEHGKECRHEY